MKYKEQELDKLSKKKDDLEEKLKNSNTQKLQDEILQLNIANSRVSGFVYLIKDYSRLLLSYYVIYYITYYPNQNFLILNPSVPFVCKFTHLRQKLQTSPLHWLLTEYANNLGLY